jgi:hypothetical protein
MVGPTALEPVPLPSSRRTSPLAVRASRPQAPLCFGGDQRCAGRGSMAPNYSRGEGGAMNKLRLALICSMMLLRRMRRFFARERQCRTKFRREVLWCAEDRHWARQPVARTGVQGKHPCLAARADCSTKAGLKSAIGAGAVSSLRIDSRKSGSQLNPSWREMDSNSRFRGADISPSHWNVTDFCCGFSRRV